LEDRVPDARTIWLFREKLTTAGAIKRLFEQFDAMLRQAGCIAMSGQIVDASLVAAPRQRDTDDEKKAIKQGRIPPNSESVGGIGPHPARRIAAVEHTDAAAYEGRRLRQGFIRRWAACARSPSHDRFASKWATDCV
jgi:hypothetical protein